MSSVEKGAVTVAAAVAMLIVIVVTFPLLGAEFIARLDDGALAIERHRRTVSLAEPIQVLMLCARFEK